MLFFFQIKYATNKRTQRTYSIKWRDRLLSLLWTVSTVQFLPMDKHRLVRKPNHEKIPVILIFAHTHDFCIRCSGKTHTMLGTPDQPGITVLAVRNIFQNMNENSDRSYLLRLVCSRPVDSANSAVNNFNLFGFFRSMSNTGSATLRSTMSACTIYWTNVMS